MDSYLFCFLRERNILYYERRLKAYEYQND